MNKEEEELRKRGMGWRYCAGEEVLVSGGGGGDEEEGGKIKKKR